MEPVKEQWLNKYEFNVYRIDNEWKEVGGVYIFAGENADKEWVAYYIGMTESLKEKGSEITQIGRMQRDVVPLMSM